VRVTGDVRARSQAKDCRYGVENAGEAYRERGWCSSEGQDSRHKGNTEGPGLCEVGERVQVLQVQGVLMDESR
jgi:membrane protein implicated in regulation of membrane protease activity